MPGCCSQREYNPTQFVQPPWQDVRIRHAVVEVRGDARDVTVGVPRRRGKVLAGNLLGGFGSAPTCAELLERIIVSITAPRTFDAPIPLHRNTRRAKDRRPGGSGFKPSPARSFF